MQKRRQEAEVRKKHKESIQRQQSDGQSEVSAGQRIVPAGERTCYIIIDVSRHFSTGFHNSEWAFPVFSGVLFDALHPGSNDVNMHLSFSSENIGLSRDTEHERRPQNAGRAREEGHGFLDRLIESLLGVVFFFRQGRRASEHSPDRRASPRFEIRNLVINVFTMARRDDAKGTRRVVSPEDIQKIDTAAYESDEKAQCPICLSNFEKGEILRHLKCKHSFHQGCVDPWLLRSADTCPMCRVPVF